MNNNKDFSNFKFSQSFENDIMNKIYLIEESKKSNKIYIDFIKKTAILVIVVLSYYTTISFIDNIDDIYLYENIYTNIDEQIINFYK